MCPNMRVDQHVSQRIISINDIKVESVRSNGRRWREGIFLVSGAGKPEWYHNIKIVRE